MGNYYSAKCQVIKMAHTTRASMIQTWFTFPLVHDFITESTPNSNNNAGRNNNRLKPRKVVIVIRPKTIGIRQNTAATIKGEQWYIKYFFIKGSIRVGLRAQR